MKLETQKITDREEKADTKTNIQKLQKQKKSSLKAAKNAINDLQLKYQLRSMEPFEELVDGEYIPTFEIEPIQEFELIVKEILIQPYGDRMNTLLIELFSELELSNDLVEELQAKCTRRHQRKSLTPQKINREHLRSSSRSASKNIFMKCEVQTQTEANPSDTKADSMLGKRYSQKNEVQNLFSQCYS